MKKIFFILLFICLFYNQSYALDPLSIAVGMAINDQPAEIKKYEAIVITKEFANSIIEVSNRMDSNGQFTYCFEKKIDGILGERTSCDYKKLSLEEFIHEKFPNKIYVGMLIQGDKKFLLLKDK